MLSFFRKVRQAAPVSNTVNTADTAKDRLQILLAQERSDRSRQDYLPMLQRDIMEVVRKYLRVGDDNVDIKLERGDDLSTLEINIELPAGVPARGAA